MKILLLLPVITCLDLSYHSAVHFSPISTNDTAIVNHILDGVTGEWPDEKFEADKETGIHYAVDNDKQTIFLALRIPAIKTQMKMMRQGMDLYIDVKGKKKESRGIEFPIQMESERKFNDQQNNQENQQNNNQPRNFDIKAARNSMIHNLDYMKLFGFIDMVPFAQKIQMEGTANIAFTWDSSDVMHIEYSIPLKLLDESPSSLNQKNISIGWKIKGIEIPTDNNTARTVTSTSTIVGVPAGSSPPVNRSGGNSPSRTDIDKALKDQFFWTKYTISLQPD